MSVQSNMLRAVCLLLLLLAACKAQTRKVQHNPNGNGCPGMVDFDAQTYRDNDSVNVTLNWRTDQISQLRPAFYSITVCDNRTTTCNVYEPLTDKQLELAGWEYWTGYTLTGYVFCNNTGGETKVRSVPAVIRVSTGRGSPRNPKYFWATTTGSNEALLNWFDPAEDRRQPTKYTMKVCGPKSPCFTVNTARTKSDGYQKQLTNLTEKTDYTVTLYAVIVDDVDTFRSPPIEASFTTNAYDYNPLRNLQYSLTPGHDSVDIKLTWNAPESGETPCCYKFMACTSDGACTAYEVSEGTELVIKGKPYFSITNVTGFACYSKPGPRTLCSEGNSVNIDTGAGNPPPPKYLQVKTEAPTVGTVIWVDPTKGSRRTPDFYEVQLSSTEAQYQRTYTRRYHANETYSVTASDLTPGTSYNVNVVAVITDQATNYTSQAAVLDFTTPKSDFLSLVNFKAATGTPGERSIDIALSWSVPSHAHRNLKAYRILVCKELDSDCDLYTAEGSVTKYIVKDAPYWQDYVIRASALFHDYGATIESEWVKTTVSTGPVAPWVENFTVTAEGTQNPSIKVTWDGPKNGHVTGYSLTVCNTSTRACDESIVEATRDDDGYQLYLNDVDSWTTYNISLYGYYFYEGTWYNGTACIKAVRTNPGDPDPVHNANYTITNLTLADLTWERPSVTRGPLDGYTVVCESLHDEVPLLFNKSVNADVTQLVLELKEQQTDFQCNITAYNLFSESKLYSGPVTLYPHTLGIHAPTNLNVTRINATALTLQWDVDPHASNYSVHFNPGTNESASTSTESKDNKTRTYEIVDLKPWTPYTVTVQNCGDEYCGKRALLHVRTDVAAPSAVEKFQPGLEGYVNFTFKWQMPKQPNGPIDGYLLTITNLEREQKFDYEIDGLEASYTAHVTDQYTRYEASIVAFNNDTHHGHILYGPAVVVNISTLGEGAMPPYPDPTKLDSDDAVIEWTKPKDKKHKIVLYLVNVTDHDGHEVFNDTVGVTNVTVDHLHPWTSYDVALESCTDNKTCGPVFKAAQFRTDVAAPSAPRSLTAKDITKNSITVSWQEPTVHNGPIDGYIVTWSNGTNHISSANTNATEFKITSLPASTNCTVHVLAFNTGYTKQKRGPEVTLFAVTLPTVSTATIVLAVIIPILVIAIVVGAVIAYKKHKQRSGMTVLVNES